MFFDGKPGISPLAVPFLSSDFLRSRIPGSASKCLALVSDSKGTICYVSKSLEKGHNFQNIPIEIKIRPTGPFSNFPAGHILYAAGISCCLIDFEEISGGNMTKRELAKIVGNNLLNIRSQRGFTQDDVAEKAGISTSYYANLERDNKSMSLLVLRKLADALEVSTDSILYANTSQSRLQNILSILRNKPESFIIGAEEILRLLAKNFA